MTPLFDTDNAVGFAAALRFPLMGDQVITPRRPTNGDSNDSLTRRRLGSSLERRREIAERREELLQKRHTGELDERGLWDWISDTAGSIANTVGNAAKSLPSLFDGSSNCYVKGYPTFNTGCASKATPYFRKGVKCSRFLLLIVEPRYLCGREFIHHQQESSFPCFIHEMAEQYENLWDACPVLIELSQDRRHFQRWRTSSIVEWSWCL